MSLESNSLFWAAAFLMLSPFGMALQPIFVLAPLQLYCLLRTVSLALTSAKTIRLKAACVVGLIFLCSFGWTIGNAGLFNLHGFRVANLVSVFLLSTVAFIGFVLLGILPAHVVSVNFDTALLQPLAWPACWTAVFMIIGWTPLGTFGNPAYMFLDFRPFAAAASIVGLHGLNFLVSLLVSAAVAYSSEGWPGVHGSRLTFSKTVVITTLLLLTAGSMLEYHDVYYQRSVRGFDHPLITGSCVFRDNLNKYSKAAPDLLAQSKERLKAGVDIVLWSEAAVVVTRTQEATLLADAKAILRKAAKPDALLGITYALNLTARNSTSQLLRNMFVLLSNNGTLWNYQKSHPVPVTEAGVEAGPAILPVADSPYGRLGGAICFDMDSTTFLQQAGWERVSLLLQPSNTWGPIGQLHFRDNALRAVENGFVLFRCSANGFSGVVTPYYDWVHHLPTFQSETRTFQIPLYGYRRTVYSVVGWWVEALVLLLAIVVWLLAVVPAGVAGVLIRWYAPPWLAHGLVGYTSEELWLLAQVPEQQHPLLSHGGAASHTPRGGPRGQGSAHV